MVFLFQFLIVLSLLFLVVGLIKPKWVMFWSDEPDRFWVAIIATVAFMASFTGYGEYLKREKLAEEEAKRPVFSHPAPLPREETTTPSPTETKPE